MILNYTETRKERELLLD